MDKVTVFRIPKYGESPSHFLINDSLGGSTAYLVNDPNIPTQKYFDRIPVVAHSGFSVEAIKSDAAPDMPDGLGLTWEQAKIHWLANERVEVFCPLHAIWKPVLLDKSFDYDQSRIFRLAPQETQTGQLSYEEAESRWANGEPIEALTVDGWRMVVSNWGGSSPRFPWPRDTPFRIPSVYPWKLNQIPLGAQIRSKREPCCYLLITGGRIGGSGGVIIFAGHVSITNEEALAEWEWRLDAAHQWKPCASSV